MFEGVKDKIKIRMAEKYFDKLNENEIIEKGEYIQSLCMNKKNVIGYGMIEWYHHIPFVNENEDNRMSNWKLTTKEKSDVKNYIQDLKEYAKHALILYEWYEIEDLYQDFLILPPWLVFPLYPANAIGWKKGLGQEYKKMYFDILRELDEKQRRRFTKQFPVPEYFSEMYYGMNITGINMIEEGSLL